MYLHLLCALSALCALCAGCDSDLTRAPDASAPDASAPLAGQEAEAVWSALREAIDAAAPEELVVIIGDGAGARFTHEKGATATTLYPIASASKLITALMILKLTEEGALSLSDHPQRHLPWWTSDPADPRSRVTLEQLLSFTSGFSGSDGLAPGDEGVPCVEDANTTLSACAQEIYAQNFTYEPGTTFFYGPAHMQIAAAMAEAATGEGWGALFERLLRAPLGLSRRTFYAVASAENPRAAGGVVSTAADYALILRALMGGELLSASALEALTRDHTPAGTTLASVPAAAAGWHYALGSWRECAGGEYTASCEAPGVLSSPGAFGFYPWFDEARGLWGVVATRLSAGGAQVIVPLGQSWYARALEVLGGARP